MKVKKCLLTLLMVLSMAQCKNYDNVVVDLFFHRFSSYPVYLIRVYESGRIIAFEGEAVLEAECLNMSSSKYKEEEKLKSEVCDRIMSIAKVVEDLSAITSKRQYKDSWETVLYINGRMKVKYFMNYIDELPPQTSELISLLLQNSPFKIPTDGRGIPIYR